MVIPQRIIQSGGGCRRYLRLRAVKQCLKIWCGRRRVRERTLWQRWRARELDADALYEVQGFWRAVIEVRVLPRKPTRMSSSLHVNVVQTAMRRQCQYSSVVRSTNLHSSARYLV